MDDISNENERQIDKDTCRLEYSSLRSEILKRIELRHQILALTLTFAAAFLGFGVSNANLALVYPPLAALLSLAWSQNDLQTRKLATYIRKYLEDDQSGWLPDLGWETKQFERRSGSRSWRFVALSHGGTILITQVIAVVIGVEFPLATFNEAFLLVVDAAALLTVLWVIRRSR